MIVREIALGESTDARLDCYVLDPIIATGWAKTRPAVVLLPGGAYLAQAHNEAEPVAMRLLGLGYDVFILRYSCHITNPEMRGREDPVFDPSSHYPVQVIETMRALAYVRRHATEWGIDPNHVTLMGFSAGGHISCSLAERFDDPQLLAAAGATPNETRPDALALCYPMVTGNLVRNALTNDPITWGPIQAKAVFGTDKPCEEEFELVDLRRYVRPDMPRTFIWQTAEDEIVNPVETLELAIEMRRNGVPCELHLFERGYHGMALADATTAVDGKGVNAEAAAWVDLFARWAALEDIATLMTSTTHTIG